MERGKEEEGWIFKDEFICANIASHFHCDRLSSLYAVAYSHCNYLNILSLKKYV
jgi:hypothetical protein